MELRARDHPERYYGLARSTTSEISYPRAVLTQGEDLVYAASRTVTSAETRYSIIEREVLIVSYATKKLRRFLIERSVTLKMDHKPRLRLIKKKELDNARLNRMLCQLWDVDFKKTEYIQGEKSGWANYFPCKSLDEVYSYGFFK